MLTKAEVLKSLQSLPGKFQAEDAIEKINSFTDHKQAVSFVETELMPVYGWTADGDAFAQLQELILRRFIS